VKSLMHTLFLPVAIVAFCLLPAAQAQRQVRSPERARTGMSLRGSDLQKIFPLEAGNEWVYSDGTENFTVKVLREIQEANGLKYFEVTGYFPEDPADVRMLRQGPLGQILEYNPAGEDFLWYSFSNLRESWLFQTKGNIPCITGSQVTIGATAAAADMPAGSFSSALRLDFGALCFDAGLGSEYFAAGVGLVQRVLNTFAGPRTVRLVSAKVGTSRYPESLYGVTVSMDRPVYYNNLMPPVVNPWPTAKVVLIVRNATDFPAAFTFATSQRFDFLVRDAQGAEILRWSDGRAFLEVMGQETLRNDMRSYAADIVLRSRDGKSLPEGFYVLEGYLTAKSTRSGLPMMTGAITFEIRNVY
jgi:hypothetical protein